MFNHMKIYSVHFKPGESPLEQKPLFVREGFNIWAFALTGFWALYHRLWLPMVGILAFNMALALVINQQIFSEPTTIIMQLAFNALVGFHANDWLRAHLAHQGYLFADITAADSLLRAEQRYFERALATA